MRNEPLDVRGLSCPQPVLQTRAVLEQSQIDEVRVIVDDQVQVDNVTQLARSLGWLVQTEKEEEGDFYLHLSRAPQDRQNTVQEGIAAVGQAVVVLIPSEFFGQGEAQLGTILMRSFIKTLKDAQPLPSALIFVNSGVKLTTSGSELIEDIQALVDCGIEVLSCGTCLDFYSLKSKLQVGSVTNMLCIVNTLVAADRIVRP